MNKPTLEQAKTLLATLTLFEDRPILKASLILTALTGAYQDGAINTLIECKEAVKDLKISLQEMGKGEGDRGTLHPPILVSTGN